MIIRQSNEEWGSEYQLVFIVIHSDKDMSYKTNKERTTSSFTIEQYKTSTKYATDFRYEGEQE